MLPGIPQDARETDRAMDRAAAEGADYVLVLHGGFTMGDVARAVTSRRYRVGFLVGTGTDTDGGCAAEQFRVAEHVAVHLARGVRDLTTDPVQWYHGAPEDADLQRRLTHTIRALTAAKALQGARIGVIGGLAMTFYNMEVNTSALRARLGVEVAHHDIHELTGRMAAMDAGRVTAEVAAMDGGGPGAGCVGGADAPDGRPARWHCATWVRGMTRWPFRTGPRYRPIRGCIRARRFRGSRRRTGCPSPRKAMCWAR